MRDSIKVFSGNSHLELAKEIASYINVPLGKCLSTHFADGEIRFELQEPVRGHDIFIIQPTSSTDTKSVNDTFMELSIMIDAFKRAAAENINVIIPYYGYARQDRKEGSLSPITAKLIADMLTTAGATRVVMIDLHADQIQGFFNIPVENLNATQIIADYFNKKQLENVVVASPDMGGVKRARKLAQLMNDAPFAIIEKRRSQPNVSEVMTVLGADVAGKSVIIVDDLIDTAGTILQAATSFKNCGATEVYIAATHPVLSTPSAITNLNQDFIKEVVVCNTMVIPEHKLFDKLTVLSVATLLGDAILNIHNDLFEKF